MHTEACMRFAASQKNATHQVNETIYFSSLRNHGCVYPFANKNSLGAAKTPLARHSDDQSTSPRESSPSLSLSHASSTTLLRGFSPTSPTPSSPSELFLHNERE